MLCNLSLCPDTHMTLDSSNAAGAQSLDQMAKFIAELHNAIVWQMAQSQGTMPTTIEVPEPANEEQRDVVYRVIVGLARDQDIPVPRIRMNAYANIVRGSGEGLVHLETPEHVLDLIKGGLN